MLYLGLCPALLQLSTRVHRTSGLPSTLIEVIVRLRTGPRYGAKTCVECMYAGAEAAVHAMLSEGQT